MFNLFFKPKEDTLNNNHDNIIKTWGTRSLCWCQAPPHRHTNLLPLSSTKLLGDQTRLCHARPGCTPSGCWHLSNRKDRKDPAESTRNWQPFNTAECASTNTHTTHTHTLTNAHPLYFALPIQPYRSQISCQLYSLARLFSPSPPLSCCARPLSFLLIKWFTISVPTWSTGKAANQISQRKQRGVFMHVMSIGQEGATVASKRHRCPERGSTYG